MKISIIILFLFLLQTSQMALAIESPLYCMLDESNELTIFQCRDENTKTIYKKAVEPIMVSEVVHYLEEKGVEIISTEEFLQRTLIDDISQLQEGALENPHCEAEQEYKTYFKSKEFNALSPSDPTIQHLVVLAKAMHEAGVCNIPVRKENFNSIGVSDSDTLLRQFLCISNSESLFGELNIGMGGRGPWGIHPMHNQAEGTMAYVNGRNVKLDRDGVCYPSQAIVRNSNGDEIKKSDLYLDPSVILDNARCALTLYQTKGSLGGLSPWGTTKAWGSNRHCSKKNRERLDFAKYLGQLSCCSDKCKEDIQESI